MYQTWLKKKKKNTKDDEDAVVFIYPWQWHLVLQRGHMDITQVLLSHQKSDADILHPEPKNLNIKTVVRKH